MKRTKQLRGSIHCQRCRSQPETLAHALNHCCGYMGMIRSRHGEILKRVRKAIPSDLGEVFLEQEIPGDPEKNRPDLVMINRSLERAIIVDVTISFEGEENSLRVARATKENKYSGLKTCCRRSTRRWRWLRLWLEPWARGIRIMSLSSGCCGSEGITPDCLDVSVAYRRLKEVGRYGKCFVPVSDY